MANENIKAANGTEPKAATRGAALKAAPITHLVVRAVQPGFRRGGRAWGAEEVTVDAKEFSAEQIEALLAEPMLVVVPVVGGLQEIAGAK